MSLFSVCSTQINDRFIEEKVVYVLIDVVNCAKCVVGNTQHTCLCLAAKSVSLLKWS